MSEIFIYNFDLLNTSEFKKKPFCFQDNYTIIKQLKTIGVECYWDKDGLFLPENTMGVYLVKDKVIVSRKYDSQYIFTHESIHAFQHFVEEHGEELQFFEGEIIEPDELLKKYYKPESWKHEAQAFKYQFDAEFCVQVFHKYIKKFAR